MYQKKKMLQKNLNKLKKPMQFYLIPKKEKNMTSMASIGNTPTSTRHNAASMRHATTAMAASTTATTTVGATSVAVQATPVASATSSSSCSAV